ncbi:flagellar hook capping FlgD N-terminal domain-containing protein [Paenibacillus aquistagni]|uniref:Flagellar basal-body rod modification protein FlgD n=1 Tax=Paenibacillus aquistagni TaxID=1852522 RepID=A0A1X7IP95_9BACL|nr:flagellar hook capping FlgD N-terminal domain-containing protein [Paenibacillus aquistagni]NMM51241.1 flagellar hook capping protein [Paenibacillus aquistagni]SMG16241.1 flagellar basal-body rod modification protein FlgD [Paenibacillus aquistagni]
MTANAGITNNLLWPNYSKENLDKVKPTGAEKTLDKDDFLHILITQLANQDPMQPMEDKEFIAQMAQFTSVELLNGISTQLQAMNQSLGMSSSLIGKEISWHGVGEAGADGSTIPVIMSGVVDSIIIRQGISYAKAGDQEIALTDILEIRNPGTGESGSEESGSEAEGGNEAGEQA